MAKEKDSFSLIQDFCFENKINFEIPRKRINGVGESIKGLVTPIG